MEEMAETVGGLLEDSDTITTEVEEEIIALPGEVEELVVVAVEEEAEVNVAAQLGTVRRKRKGQSRCRRAIVRTRELLRKQPRVNLAHSLDAVPR